MKSVVLAWCVTLGGCSLLLSDNPEEQPPGVDAAVDIPPVPGECATEDAPDSFCAPGICDRRANACIPEAQIVYVSEEGNNVSQCTLTVPCDTISRGIAIAGNQVTRRIVHVARGDYAETVRHAEDPVRLIGFGATLTGDGSSATITVIGGGKLLVDGLIITTSDSLAAADGVAASDDAEIDLFRVVVHGHGGHGVSLNMATGRLDASRVFDNAVRGVANIESTLTMTSTLVYRNKAGGVQLFEGTLLNFSLNTIADNQNQGLSCSGGPVGTFTGNIVTGTNAVVGCMGFDHGYADGVIGGTNLATPPTFKSAALDDYRLVTGSTGIDYVVDVMAGPVDANGTPRVIDGVANVGAHEEVVP